MLIGTLIFALVAALADAEPLPPETRSHTGTIIALAVAAVVVVLVSVVVLRRIARTRRARAAEEEDQARRSADGTEGSSRPRGEETEGPK